MTAPEKLFNGDIKIHNGGSDLEFDSIFDDVSNTGLIWLKRIIWYAIETLYYEERWEKVVELIYRFCALSRYGCMIFAILDHTVLISKLI